MAEPTPDEPDQFLQSISRSAPHASRWNPQLVEDGTLRICAWPTMESRTWQTRPVDLADVEQVAAHGCYRPEDAARRQAYVEWVGPRILSGRYVGRFAVAADIVLGGAGAILLDWGPTRANPGGLMARIVNVYTEQPYRGRGVATELVQAVMGHCEALGVREFNLGATPHAEALYRSLGFETYVQEMRRRVR